MAMLEMFVEAREVAKILKSKGEGENSAGSAVDIHWDLLQVHI